MTSMDSIERPGVFRDSRSSESIYSQPSPVHTLSSNPPWARHRNSNSNSISSPNLLSPFTKPSSPSLNPQDPPLRPIKEAISDNNIASKINFKRTAPTWNVDLTSNHVTPRAATLKAPPPTTTTSSRSTRPSLLRSFTLPRSAKPAFVMNIFNRNHSIKHKKSVPRVSLSEPFDAPPPPLPMHNQDFLSPTSAKFSSPSKNSPVEFNRRHSPHPRHSSATWNASKVAELLRMRNKMNPIPSPDPSVNSFEIDTWRHPLPSDYSSVTSSNRKQSTSTMESDHFFGPGDTSSDSQSLSTPPHLNPLSARPSLDTPPPPPATSSFLERFKKSIPTPSLPPSTSNPSTLSSTPPPKPTSTAVSTFKRIFRSSVSPSPKRHPFTRPTHQYSHSNMRPPPPHRRRSRSVGNLPALTASASFESLPRILLRDSASEGRLLGRNKNAQEEGDDDDYISDGLAGSILETLRFLASTTPSPGPATREEITPILSPVARPQPTTLPRSNSFLSLTDSGERSRDAVESFLLAVKDIEWPLPPATTLVKVGMVERKRDSKRSSNSSSQIRRSHSTPLQFEPNRSSLISIPPTPPSPDNMLHLSNMRPAIQSPSQTPKPFSSSPQSNNIHFQGSPSPLLALSGPTIDIGAPNRTNRNVIITAPSLLGLLEMLSLHSKVTILNSSSHSSERIPMALMEESKRLGTQRILLVIGKRGVIDAEVVREFEIFLPVCLGDVGVMLKEM